MFEKCSNETFEGVCKSEDEINKWLSRKFVFIALNNMRFSTREFADNLKITSEVNTIWIPVNSQIREEIVYKVQLTEVEL